ncbi:hypothetical protein MIT9_P0798 [Methylomarinovum caldicuralii]|uniref:DUF2231 domain-containing protein n=1 Tax=Methylomarinovum caldicuralii TaxID=438856 RepID=A0AAU9BY67_9GAMM|nr:DUF2231 domain-containing protein [Methylomarinovum caldicuralii]BCX81220.1 hypothetical protein MIT9_P0798 [Methylomarinovum caldicuralii]
MTFIVEIFPGLREMMNWHPLWVHFPIAFLSVFFLVDLLAAVLRSRPLFVVANWLLGLGALGASVAAAFGLQAALTVPHPPQVHEILETHRYFALNATALAWLLLIWRFLNRGRFCLLGRLFHLLLALFMVLNLVLAADYGGLMVYKYGVGVKAVPAWPPGASGHRHGSAWDEIREWLHEIVPHSHASGHEHHHH